MNDIFLPSAKHQHYIDLGYCQQKAPNRAWCVLPAGHTEKHFSLRVLPDGSFIRGDEWD